MKDKVSWESELKDCVRTNAMRPSYDLTKLISVITILHATIRQGTVTVSWGLNSIREHILKRDGLKSFIARLLLVHGSVTACPLSFWDARRYLCDRITEVEDRNTKIVLEASQVQISDEPRHLGIT